MSHFAWQRLARLAQVMRAECCAPQSADGVAGKKKAREKTNDKHGSRISQQANGSRESTSGIVLEHFQQNPCKGDFWQDAHCGELEQYLAVSALRGIMHSHHRLALALLDKLRCSICEF